MKDIFEEDGFMPVKGLVRRYKNRVLIELTLLCPKECSFCFRKWRKLNNREELNSGDINNILEYISTNHEINEVIFSGGEPLMVPKLFEESLVKLAKLKQIKIFRLHTRAPIDKPELITNNILKLISGIKTQIFYVSIHVNHPKELTQKSLKVIKSMRKAGVILFSQSVLLKGVNDSVEILKELFTKLIQLGVRPYNIYRCNEMEHTKNFIIPFQKEVELMSQLRKEISGIACPTYIVDSIISAHKIPVPLNYWSFDKTEFKDFNGKINQIN